MSEKTILILYLLVQLKASLGVTLVGFMQFATWNDYWKENKGLWQGEYLWLSFSYQPVTQSDYGLSWLMNLKIKLPSKQIPLRNLKIKSSCDCDLFRNYQSIYWKGFQVIISSNSTNVVVALSIMNVKWNCQIRKWSFL